MMKIGNNFFKCFFPPFLISFSFYFPLYCTFYFLLFLSEFSLHCLLLLLLIFLIKNILKRSCNHMTTLINDLLVLNNGRGDARMASIEWCSHMTLYFATMTLSEVAVLVLIFAISGGSPVITVFLQRIICYL